MTSVAPIEAVHMDTIGMTPSRLAAEGKRMRTVKLLKNYRPMGAFEAVGYEKPAVLRKNARGVMETVEEATFVRGELAPSPMGTPGTEEKIWAGTTIRLEHDEAVRVRKLGIAEYELDD